MDISENLITSSDYENVIEELQRSGIQLRDFLIDTVNSSLVTTEQNTVSGNDKFEDSVAEISVAPEKERYLRQASPVCTIPCREFYPGPLNFAIYLDSTTADRRSWVYSHKLNKVYIDMNKPLLVQFQVQEFIPQLKVRALPVFSQQDHVSKPLERCEYHVFSDDMYRKAHAENVCTCVDYNLVGHVVQCKHLQSQYEYDAESGRHSVVVPLDPPQVGSDTTTVEYSFVCKTSCPRGMNRRPMDVVFTLESALGKVIGRQIVAVKVCSCPRRDKEKEESYLTTCNKSVPGEKRKFQDRNKIVGGNKMHKRKHMETKADSEKSGVTSVENSDLALLPAQINRMEMQLKDLSSQVQSVQAMQSLLQAKFQEMDSQMQAKLHKMDSLWQAVIKDIEAKHDHLLSAFGLATK